MSGIPFVPPKQTPVNSSGRPYASATLTFYQAGTTTPLAVYADAALTTGVGVNGVVTASSSGLFPAIYLAGTYNAKCVLKNSSGTTLWTEDDIPTTASVTAEALGDAM